MTTTIVERSGHSTRTRVIGLVLMTAVIGLAATAQAKKDERLQQLITCTNTCLNEEATCQGGCCGRIFCKRSCLEVCYDNERVCEGACDISFQGDPDGAFADTVTQGPKGRALRVTGPLHCPPGAIADLGVTLSQPSGATARGHARVVCPTGDTTFTARAVVIGDTRFQPLSPATACGAARIHAGAQGVRSLQWCREVTVLPEGVGLEE